ncbi:DUF1775 domain-containing protein [Patulibacter minatonensis]|uniref:DUF1775 domain-containing protein n=1 Tax=Patulibacter minatonensis TaxID=298163 RepID=UPI00047BEB79|nr:DUF1775 domain-containing protein [Patulibacter minatonensis]
MSRRAALAAAIAVVVPLAGAGTAGAHVQLQPSTVAPDDPVEFTVLIPSEREAHTTKVDLKLPPGVIPFSYGETPGWKRKLITAPDGAVDRVVWTGKLAEDGFAAFRFLASTPDKPTTLTWKAIQTYDEGPVARWIGAPGSESPAPVTKVVAGAPRQNAGGEGTEDTSAPATTSGAASAKAPVATTATAGGSPDDTDWVARGLGISALLVAILGVAVLRRSGTA